MLRKPKQQNTNLQCNTEKIIYYISANITLLSKSGLCFI